MNTSSKSILFSLILLIVSIIVYQKITKPQLIPVYEENWWGPAKNNNQIVDKSIKSFKIIFTDNVSFFSISLFVNFSNDINFLSTFIFIFLFQF